MPTNTTPPDRTFPDYQNAYRYFDYIREQNEYACATCGATVLPAAHAKHMWWHRTMAGHTDGPRPELSF